MRNGIRPRARTILVCLAALLGGGLGVPVLGQAPLTSPVTSVPAAVVPSTPSIQEIGAAEVQNVLARGEELEREARWSEALTHYEDALRNFPGSNDIERRLSVARIHFDLARRYNDSSYLGSLRTLSEAEALEVFSEVLLKIHTHYVGSPNWQQLIGHGADHLDVAFSDAEFLRHHLPGQSPDRIAACRQAVRRSLESRTISGRYEARSAVADVTRYLSEQLRIPPAATVLEFTCGAVNSLDEYSNYLTGAQLDDVFSQIEGNFVGLGVELKAEDRALLIVNVIPGGPAHAAGLKGGDRIIEVDGRSTNEVSTDTAADLLKGPEGTPVQLVLTGSDGTVRRSVVERRRVDVPSVEQAEILDQQLGIAYFRLTTFQKTTSRDIDAALWKLHRQGMRLLIMDVRGNPGGLLTAAVEVADKFIGSGTIVSTRGRNTREDADYKAHVPGTWRVPLVVLIDGDSASASEIFAAAIHDHRRGTVIGQRSYGKGSVQGIFPLNAYNAGIRLTTAKFYSPNGQAISRQGVSPDVVVRSAAKPANDGTNLALADDSVLNAALTFARQQFSSRPTP